MPVYVLSGPEVGFKPGTPRPEYTLSTSAVTLLPRDQKLMLQKGIRICLVLPLVP